MHSLATNDDLSNDTSIENSRLFSLSKEFIQFRDVHKAYSDKLVVMDGLNLDMRSDDRLVIIGPSGSGKSTLLRVMMGLEDIERGEIRVDGQTYIAGTTNKSQRINHDIQKKIGMVFQHYTLFPHLSVLSNLTLAPVKVRGMSMKDAIESARKYMRLLGLENKLDAYPSQLSGGQKQRVAIARALMLEPQLMLFDEVTSALDPEMVLEVQNVMLKLAEQNMAMIIVTHDMHFARDIATRVVFCAEGKVVEDGPPEQIFKCPKQPRTREFLNKVLHLQ